MGNNFRSWKKKSANFRACLDFGFLWKLIFEAADLRPSHGGVQLLLRLPQSRKRSRGVAWRREPGFRKEISSEPTYHPSSSPATLSNAIIIGARPFWWFLRANKESAEWRNARRGDESFMKSASQFIVVYLTTAARTCDVELQKTKKRAPSSLSRRVEKPPGVAQCDFWIFGSEESREKQIDGKPIWQGLLWSSSFCVALWKVDRAYIRNKRIWYFRSNVCVVYQHSVHMR